MTYTGNIYKIIWFPYSDNFKVFYYVNERPHFFYETDTVNNDMEQFMKNASYCPGDFQVEWTV